MQDQTKRDKERAAFTVTQTTYLLQQEVWEELPEGNLSARTTREVSWISAKIFCCKCLLSLGLFFASLFLHSFPEEC